MNSKLWLTVLIYMIIAMIFIRCADNGIKPKQSWISNFNYDTFNIATDLDWSQRWHIWGLPLNYYENFPHDQNKIILLRFGEEYYYHTYEIAAPGMGYVYSFVNTNDSSFMDLINRNAYKLSDLGDRIHYGIYEPITFNVPVHGSNDILIAPFYSGFDQGMALSFLSRAYQITGDIRLKGLADSVFTTFLYTDSSFNSWTCMVDSLGYYWVEEYPSHPPEHVFNGFMIAIIGLHDYYLISNDSRCLILIEGALTTVKHYFEQYRNPGGASCYCLKHRHVDQGYHFLVMSLLRQMTLISDDSTFSAFADTLYQDYH